ncbi:LytR C-terminal domain-containing protein [Corynebacterium glucuronolyticum]|uniref:LytR C-terminal domain-containing protein n=1 Tax=Corynebacterium glucuronolyticum TaxID=39791 RepID=UPI00019C1B49|nr:LytR C-terminal domain-containing protein [Corynebacterium glucuronolyticum]EEI26000.1 hypothetical protein HMPREF0294_2465 [Corynebacterium glucuronolyticum ATCC 51867]MCT1563523.1 LytR C-terminal domain-containing protein [Corynebacterium glucuronolyticum]QRO82474.1 LytR C-terminal domain-containing protein [Corynebacterium glucuronolyticum]
MEQYDDETQVYDDRPSRGVHAADSPRTAAAATGVPLRGIGMIAIAVAILILLWAIFFLGGDKEDTAATGTQTTTAQAAPGKTAAEESPAGETTAATVTTATHEPSTLTEPSDGNRPSSEAPKDEHEARPAESQQPEPAPGAPAPAPQADRPADAPDTHPLVNVLNNSTVQGLAADVANRLTSTGNPTGTVGNLPDVETPQSMVYYSPGEEAAAKRVANQLGINYGPKIPAVEHYPGLVVVVTQDLQ